MTHFNFKSHCILCLLALLCWQQNEMKPCSSLIGILIVCASLCVFFREQNVRKHRKLGFVPLLTEKEKHVVAVVE